MKTRPVIGSIEGIDDKLYTSDKDKSNALNNFFSSAFTTEDVNTVPSFHVDKNDDIYGKPDQTSSMLNQSQDPDISV